MTRDKRYRHPSDWPDDRTLYERGKYDKASFGDLGFLYEMKREEYLRVLADRLHQGHHFKQERKLKELESHVGYLLRQIALHKAQGLSHPVQARQHKTLPHVRGTKTTTVRRP